MEHSLTYGIIGDTVDSIRIHLKNTWSLHNRANASADKACRLGIERVDTTDAKDPYVRFLFNQMQSAIHFSECFADVVSSITINIGLPFTLIRQTGTYVLGSAVAELSIEESLAKPGTRLQYELCVNSESMKEALELIGRIRRRTIGPVEPTALPPSREHSQTMQAPL